MRALASATMPQEHIATPLVAHYRRMEQRRPFVGSSQGIHHHDGVVHPELRVFFQTETGPLVVLATDQHSRAFATQQELKVRLSRWQMASNNILPLFLLVHLIREPFR